jgi:hypothetical protein
LFCGKVASGNFNLREFLSFSCRQYSKKSVWQGFSNDLFSFKFFQVIHKS